LSEAVTESSAQVDIDIDEILRLIPHRPPFLMIDRAEDFQSYKSLVGVKCVANNEPYFAGHFPGFPVMPGVMIIEAIAQTGGVLMSKSMDLDLSRKTILFMSLDNCRFRYPVRPGDVLRMPVDVVRARPEVARFKGRALVGDSLAAEVEFMAMVVERS
jgi:3-hydroxyacyl-[acyl-carrier-protein] dehydratase